MWDATPCSLVKVCLYRQFKGIPCLHYQGKRYTPTRLHQIPEVSSLKCFFLFDRKAKSCKAWLGLGGMIMQNYLTKKLQFVIVE